MSGLLSVHQGAVSQPGGESRSANKRYGDHDAQLWREIFDKAHVIESPSLAELVDSPAIHGAVAQSNVWRCPSVIESMCAHMPSVRGGADAILHVPTMPDLGRLDLPRLSRVTWEGIPLAACLDKGWAAPSTPLEGDLGDASRTYAARPNAVRLPAVNNGNDIGQNMSILWLGEEGQALRLYLRAANMCVADALQLAKSLRSTWPHQLGRVPASLVLNGSKLYDYSRTCSADTVFTG